MFNSDNFVYFVSTRSSGASFGFSSYMDKDGNTKIIVNGYDPKTGQPIARNFNFSKKDRAMRIPKNQKDKEGNSVVDFLRNSPECFGSPNNEGQPVLYKELNYTKDADLANEAKAKRIKAESLALNIEGQDLVELAASFGVVNSSESILRHRMLELAGNDPEVFIDGYNSPDREFRSVINSGIQAGILKQRGTMVLWEETVIGSDLSSTISKLMEDKKLTAAIKNAVKKVGL